jgi:hypothetical protein
MLKEKHQIMLVGLEARWKKGKIQSAGNCIDRQSDVRAPQEISLNRNIAIFI